MELTSWGKTVVVGEYISLSEGLQAWNEFCSTSFLMCGARTDASVAIICTWNRNREVRAVRCAHRGARRVRPGGMLAALNFNALPS